MRTANPPLLYIVPLYKGGIVFSEQLVSASRFYLKRGYKTKIAQQYKLPFQQKIRQSSTYCQLMFPHKKSFLAAACISALFFSSVAGITLTHSAAASDMPSLLRIGMPIEYVNYTVIRENGTLWAKIDGTYPLHVVFEPADTSNLDNASFYVTSDELPLVYPTPPGTTNIHVKIDETELDWSNFTQIYPSALHHTAIGDWSMINCTITPIPDDFVLKIHYEHPLEAINGTYLFLYDLNISPYLSPANPNSTAIFTIHTPTDYPIAQAYTTGLDSAWKTKNYTIAQEGTSETITIEVFSEYAKPLAGDLVVTFSDFTTQANPQFSPWIVALLFIIAALIALIAYRKKHRHKQGP